MFYRFLFTALAAGWLLALFHFGWGIFGPLSWFGGSVGRRTACGVFWLVWMGILVWRSGRGQMTRGHAQERGQNSERDPSLLPIIIAFWVGISLEFFLRGWGIGTLPGWFYWLGMTAWSGGMALDVCSVLTLGRFFSLRVEVRQGHRVIQSGPYRLVRHPIYTAGLLCLLGVGLSLGTWAGAVLALLCAFAAYSRRMAAEERALLVTLGEEYVAYRKRSWRLVPFVY